MAISPGSSGSAKTAGNGSSTVPSWRAGRAWAPDGQRFAFPDEDNVIVISRSGRRIWSARGADPLARSHDGLLAAFVPPYEGPPSRVGIFNQDGRRLRTVTADSLAWSPTGQLRTTRNGSVFIGDRTAVRLKRVATGARQHIFPGPNSAWPKGEPSTTSPTASAPAESTCKAHAHTPSVAGLVTIESAHRLHRPQPLDEWPPRCYRRRHLHRPNGSRMDQRNDDRVRLRPPATTINPWRRVLRLDQTHRATQRSASNGRRIRTPCSQFDTDAPVRLDAG